MDSATEANAWYTHSRSPVIASIALILVLANDKRILGAHTNGWFANTLGLLAAIGMGLAGGAVLWWWFSDHFR